MRSMFDTCNVDALIIKPGSSVFVLLLRKKGKSKKFT